LFSKPDLTLSSRQRQNDTITIRQRYPPSPIIDEQ
jgi:hypothetical protein